MQCSACRVAFHDREDEWEVIQRTVPGRGNFHWICELTICPNCKEPIIVLSARESYLTPPHDRRVIYPINSRRIDVSCEVPDDLRNDFVEAALVLEISPKASAALSRRVLQSILVEQGYQGRDLSKQVEAVLNETDPNRALPLAIRRKVDAIRNFGNFSAHPITDLTTLHVIDVDPEEAEWCLEIVTALLEHYFVQPAEDKRKLDDLNQKLASAGKPLSK